MQEYQVQGFRMYQKAETPTLEGAGLQEESGNWQGVGFQNLLDNTTSMVGEVWLGVFVLIAWSFC